MSPSPLPAGDRPGQRSGSGEQLSRQIWGGGEAVLVALKEGGHAGLLGRQQAALRWGVEHSQKCALEW